MKKFLLPLFITLLSANEYTIEVLHVNKNNYALHVGSFKTNHEALSALHKIKTKLDKETFEIKQESKNNNECICFKDKKSLKKHQFKEALHFYKMSKSHTFTLKSNTLNLNTY